jgi:hypothetical protein
MRTVDALNVLFGDRADGCYWLGIAGQVREVYTSGGGRGVASFRRLRRCRLVYASEVDPVDGTTVSGFLVGS